METKTSVQPKLIQCVLNYDNLNISLPESYFALNDNILVEQIEFV